VKQSFSQVQETFLPVIEQKLEDFFTQSAKNGMGWNAEMSRYHFSTGGKRLRALIPCWVYSAYGKNPTDAIPLGCALEMVHNATLVHDDLQDGDVVRRGKATVWKKYSEAQAINCGDAMFQFAFQMLCELDLEPSTFRRIAARVTRGTQLVIEGQAQEFVMKDEEFPRVERYLGVVQGKTAELIATAVVSAMEALGVSAEISARAEKAAIGSGILFQIQDDLLDIYGDKARDRPATDIAEGKISILIALLNELGSNDDRIRVAQVLKTPRDETTDQQISEVLKIFEKCNVKGAALQRIEKIQLELKNDPILAQQPEIHGLLSEMNRIFLKPISKLL
jgi:geranylgeranyl pyrophosphate synthase